MIDEYWQFEMAIRCFLNYLNLDDELHDLQELTDYDVVRMMPFGRLMMHAEVVGHPEFVRSVLDATLELYHEAHEWLVIFYSVALTLDGASELIAEYLNGPSDHQAFLWKVILELEAEMTEQIAANFPLTPFNILDDHNTRLIFHHVYRESLFQLNAIKSYLARRRLLL